MKHFKSKSKILSVTVIILLNSCVAYYPQVVDIPLIKEKGDIRINAGCFVAPSFYENKNTEVDENEDENETESWIGDFGVHGTISAGLTDALAFQGYLNFDMFSRIHLQVAFGTFHAFEDKTVIELYGGWGYGNGYMSTIYKNRDDYNLPFAQFNIGKSGMDKLNIDYGLGIKSGYLFCNFSDRYNQGYIHKKDGWIFEPSIFFRFGGKKVKFNTMVNYLWTNTIVDEYYFPICVSFGANFTIGNRNKDK